MNEFITLLPLISVFIIFYAILYIPQRRRNKKHKQFKKLFVVLISKPPAHAADPKRVKGMWRGEG